MVMLSVLLAANLTKTYDISGLPTLEYPLAYRITSESVMVQVNADASVTVTSTTVYRNQGDGGQAAIRVPRIRQRGAPGEKPDFTVAASWDNVPLQLKSAYGIERPGQSDLSAPVALKKQGTHALRLSYRTQLGLAGYGQKQKITGYLLNGDKPIDLYTMAYRYEGGKVFRLPNVRPKLDWEVGARGASVRIPNFRPPGRISTLMFYTDDFDSIG